MPMNTEILNQILSELKLLNESLSRKKPTRRESILGAELPEIALIWNEWAHETLSRVIEMDSQSQRFKNATARWKAKPDKSYWVGVVQRVNKSSFCLGVNEKKWRADIEFICRPDSSAKILEGKYDDKSEVKTLKQKKLLGKWLNPETGNEEDFWA